jgi:nitrogen fixation NifU-like protein
MTFDMYRELIIDHSRNPRNFGELRGADGMAERNNPLCGDQIKITYRLGKGQRITDIKFSGAGCSIARAAASILTEKVRGKSLQQLRRYDEKHFLKDIAAPISSARRRCALLSLDTLHDAVRSKKKTGIRRH